MERRIHMDLKQVIFDLKEQAIQRLTDAISRRDMAAISDGTRTLENLEKIEKKLGEITMDLERLIASGNHAAEPVVSSKSSKKLSLERAREIRNQFVALLETQGRAVSRIQGQRLYSIDKKLVGIGYASEQSPNKWWIGLPMKQYDALVLLCEDEYRKVAKFIFPKSFYEKYRENFSKNKKGNEIQFNIALEDHHYTMQMPGCGHDISIDIYENAFNNL